MKTPWQSIALASLCALLAQLPARAADSTGATAPAPILVTMDGQYIHLAKFYYPGAEKPREPRSVVVLNFMGLKCAPCRKELPLFLEVVRGAAKSETIQQSGVGFRYFVISTDPLSTKEALRAFLVEQGIDPDSEVLLDPYRKAAEKFGVNGIPRTLVISPRGRIVADIAGAAADYKTTLRKGIVAALKEDPAADE